MTSARRLAWLLIALPLLCAMTPAAAIVCGKGVPPGEQPWLVQLVRLKPDGGVYHGAGEVICSGSLLDSRIVVTAAHCVKEIGARPKGVLIWTARGASEPYRVTDHLSIAEGQASDVALLLLERPAATAAYVQLPDERANIAPGSTAQIAGYGTVWPIDTAISKAATDRLCPPLEDGAKRAASRAPREGMVDILDVSDCYSNQFKDVGVDAKAMICAHGPKLRPSGICGGDSGGPLVALNAGQGPTIIGVAHGVSRLQTENPENCIANPGIFTAVAPLVQRIQTSIDSLLRSPKPMKPTK